VILARFGETSPRALARPNSRSLSAERAGFESVEKGRLGSSRVAKGTQSGGGLATQEGPSGLPPPEPEDSDRATVLAIKAALDEGRYERAAALLDVLRLNEPSGRVVLIRPAGADPRK
jgi:hypothetical protein